MNYLLFNDEIIDDNIITSLCLNLFLHLYEKNVDNIVVFIINKYINFEYLLIVLLFYHNNK